jgi:hypothetical protein
MPEFINRSSPETVPSSTEAEWGRRYKIKSFRWLDPSSDI